MSLINDALKRAKQAQPPPAPSASPSLHLRPVDPAQHARHNLGLLLPVAVAVVAMLILLLLWEIVQNRSTIKFVSAKTESAQAVNTPPPRPPAPSVPAVENRVAAPLAPIPMAQENAATNPVVAAEPSPPKPAPLRLQAIVFNPARPSAMISGRTLFVGDKLGEFRVLRISPESATLVGAGQTNILSLAE